MVKISARELQRQAKQLLDLAKEKGCESNYLFTSTFQRYQQQLIILEDLAREINEGETLVTKEYVKGRCNLYSNPAIMDYNKTCDSANKTVTTLTSIIKSFDDTNKKGKAKNPLEGLFDEE